MEQRKNILICGCFDLLHVGHILLLEKASEFGNVYVAIGTDDSIRKKKGPNRPIIPQEQRMHMLIACRYVHKVRTFDFYEDPVQAHQEIIDWAKPVIGYAEGPQHNNPEMTELLTIHGIPRIIVPCKIQATTAIEKTIMPISDYETTEEAQELGKWEQPTNYGEKINR